MSYRASFVMRDLLATPGLASIDFETWPVDPRWHGERAAAGTPRGEKADARRAAEHEAELGGRAHRRRPCVLAIAHESGGEVCVRIEGGARQLRWIFAERRAALVAHNSQFETEVLLGCGIAVDVECTLLAAKALYLTAVAEDQPQPVSFSLAALVEREFGRTRDKSIRDRDWRDPAALDEEAVSYASQDAQDALELFKLYRARLEAEGLLEGYEGVARSILPTAAINLAGMVFDRGAHAELVRALRHEADRLERELAGICERAVANPASTAQISTWIIETVLDTAITRPVEPQVTSLLGYLRGRGGLRPDPGGELAARDLPRRLVSLTGMSLEGATIAAGEEGYIGLEHGRFDPDAGRPEVDDLLAAIDRELHGDRVLRLEDQEAWDSYLAECDRFERLHREDPELVANFAARLRARCGVGWRRGKNGHLAITKSLKPKMALALEPEFPIVARYLRTHADWMQQTKLLGTFGEGLAGWVDDDGRLRSQLKVGGTVTLRHTASRPNVQQMPRQTEFRALFRAPPGRTLIVCDYSQIELRLAAIIAPDEALLDVYRDGRDVHQDVADAIDLPRGSQSKACSFSMIYGAGVAGVAEAAGLDLERATKVVESFLTAYPGLRSYRERAPREAEALGCISVRPGRRIRYDPVLSTGTQAINFPIQGAAASVQMLALRRVYDALAAQPELDAHLVGAIHDEMILEAPDDERAELAGALLEDEMRAALVEIFPEAIEMGADRLAEAKVCTSWSDKD